MNLRSSQLTACLQDTITVGGQPVFVGIDGRSGAGKSTLAEAVRASLTDANRGRDVVTGIEGDQFYVGGSGLV